MAARYDIDAVPRAYGANRSLKGPFDRIALPSGTTVQVVGGDAGTRIYSDGTRRVRASAYASPDMLDHLFNPPASPFAR